MTTKGKSKKQEVKILGSTYTVGTKAHSKALYELKLIQQLQAPTNV